MSIPPKNHNITYHNNLRSETEERVWLVYTSDSYGSAAADAFVLAAGSGGQEALRARVEIARM